MNEQSTLLNIDSKKEEETPVACVLSALTPDEQAQRQKVADQVFASTKETIELQDGYMFRYPASLLETIARFIALERRCCPFFHFVLDLAPDNGPLWLSITGRAGVKEFLHMAFSHL